MTESTNSGGVSSGVAVGVTVLGATGSIGVSTLDVLRRNPERFRVVALTANRDVQGLYGQCLEFSPSFAVMADAHSAATLKQRLEAAGQDTIVLAGVGGLERVAALPEIDYVMAAIVGAAGLAPAMAAARAGKRVLLANKEALVMAGHLFMDEVREGGAQLLPIDSEHNAIFQCMPPGFGGGLERGGVRRILLTASGGPFRTAAAEQLHKVTPEQACAHPNWEMGRKISVDSATMMNKGLEVIEACWLFATDPGHIEVVVHPQSVIHSMVEYLDGSILAQLGQPDMRTPIAHALAWPERMESGVGSLDLYAMGGLDFEPADPLRFPCLGLAFRAAEAGGTAPAVLNAANEIAVQAFLDETVRFTHIPRIIEAAMDAIPARPVDALETVLCADREAREVARTQVASLS